MVSSCPLFPLFLRPIRLTDLDECMTIDCWNTNCHLELETEMKKLGKPSVRSFSCVLSAAGLEKQVRRVVFKQVFFTVSHNSKIPQRCLWSWVGWKGQLLKLNQRTRKQNCLHLRNIYCKTQLMHMTGSHLEKSFPVTACTTIKYNFLCFNKG